MSKISEFLLALTLVIRQNPKWAVTIAVLLGLIIEALTGVTVEVGDQAAKAVD